MRTALYARISSEPQEKQETINSQLADLREYHSRNNMDIVEEYIDNGYSGELFDRPALDKLRDDAKNRLSPNSRTASIHNWIASSMFLSANSSVSP
jgi:DNA invertase Pin-like site-specific DNA recombinase